MTKSTLMRLPEGASGKFAAEASGNSGLPVTGLAAAMSYRNDEHKIRPNRVKDAIGERANQAASNFPVKPSETQRVLDNGFDRILDTDDKTQVQAKLPPGIMVTSFLVFRQSLGVELERHRPSERRTWARASSPGMVWTRPERTSSNRRSASAAQSWSSRLTLAPSRLSTSRSANKARSSLGRAKASSTSCSMVIGI